MTAIAAVGGRHDLAERWGVTRQRVAQLTADASFPAPVGQINGQPVWLLEDCETWRAARRGPGRPRAGRDRDPS